MKKILFKTFISILLFTNIFCSGEKATVNINLPTIQCGMCEDTIEKKLKKTPGISMVSVPYANKSATIIYDMNKIDLPKIEKIISELGYVANSTSANPDVYERLPLCCKVPDSK